MKRCVIFDIDGTVADCEHRRHYVTGPKKNWKAFFYAAEKDKPFLHIRKVAMALQVQNELEIVYVTGRPEDHRELTETWLGRYGFPDGELFMRRSKDNRPDHVVKKEILDAMRLTGWEPIMAFDDRDSVVAMWRENGVPCAQVAPGFDKPENSADNPFLTSDAS